jgi:hypothetical protein
LARSSHDGASGLDLGFYSSRFQVPSSVTEAELRAVNTRYPAATSFALD